MKEEIILKGIDKEKTKKIKKVLSIFDINVTNYSTRKTQIKNKNEKKKEILYHLKFNDRVEVNSNLCAYFKLHPRTLNRYVKELIKEEKIFGSVEAFKLGGRGYVIKSVIPKEER